MKQQSVFFVGTQAEMGHHVAPILNSELAKNYRLQILPADEVRDRAQAGDLAVFYSEHFDRFRNCCVELKKQRVATLYMIDGILEWRNAWNNRPDEPACPFTMRPVLSHKVACIGPSQARTLSSWGNQTKVEVVGVPRFDRIGWESISTKESGEFRVLVMTAKCPGFTEAQIATTIESLSDLKTWFAANSELNGKRVVPIWRLTGNLADEVGVTNHLNDLTGTELIEALKNCDAVITSPSTAMLEAMLMNRPVALLDYHNAPKYVRAAWQINASNQIPKVINQLIAPSPARMQFQQLILQDSLLASGSAESSATKRMESLMARMLEASLEQVTSGVGELSFAANLLEPCEGHSIWDQASMFPNFSEFQNNDLIEVQAQLAHSRREIDYLNRELAQVRSELGEAHRIFAQIHQHPIAGPIVRARQKMLDWFEKARRTLGRRRNNSFSDSTSPKQPSSNLKETL